MALLTLGLIVIATIIGTVLGGPVEHPKPNVSVHHNNGWDTLAKILCLTGVLLAFIQVGSAALDEVKVFLQ